MRALIGANHNVFVAVNNQRRVCDLLQSGVTIACWYDSPFSDCGELCHGRISRHRKVTIFRARFEPLHVLASSRLARVGRRKESAQQERNRIRLFFS